MKHNLTLCAAILLASCRAPVADLHVAPDGDDSNPGTAGKPFASIERARDEIRKRRSAGALPTGGAIVRVRGGTHPLSRTLVLTHEDGGTPDAPVVYQAFGSSRPVLSGALPVSGFRPGTNGTLSADVNAQGMKGIRFRQIFFDGRRQQLARYPNVDPRRPFDTGWAFVDTGPIPVARTGATGARRMLRVAPSDLRSWSRPADGEVSIFPSHEWWNNMAPIAAFDREARILTLARNCSYEIAPGDRYFVQGPREELDAPGEWHLDTEKGLLHFWPPKPVIDPVVFAPRLRTLLEIGPGAANITFRGFTLEYCEGTAVTVKDATNCLIAGCTIRNVGDYNGGGIAIAGGHGNGVVGCDITDTGSHGISLGGGDEKTLTPAANFAENNHITRTGVFHKQGNGITVSGTGNRISRNTLHHLPRFGIQFAGQNHLIELNHIHHVCLETMDTGAIYGGSLNWLSAHGCIIRHNFIHDVIGRSGKAGRWLSPYFAWGIYLDWTAMGATVTGNIVSRTPRSGIHLHDGRDNVIENNVLVDCGTGRNESGPTSQIEFNGWDTSYGWWKREIGNWTRQHDSVKGLPAWRAVASLRDPLTAPLPDGRTMHRNVAQRNILVWRDPQPQAFQFKNLSFERNSSDSNLVWHFGLPIKTGQIQLKAVTGPDIAPPNAGFEQGAHGNMPDRWSWHIRPSTNDTAIVCGDSPHGGRGCLRIHGKLIPDNKDKESWARIPSVRSSEVRVQPGGVYRLRAWLRADRPATRAEIGLQSYRPNAYSWQSVNTVIAGTEWTLHELTARFPATPPEMQSLYVRVRLPDGNGVIWADDVELHAAEPMDEWASWLALGMDRHSLVSDPLFVNADKDDYRLSPGSPAFRIGFKRIPVERIGCYRDRLRATWPPADGEQHP